MKTWRKIFVTLLVFVLASGTLPAMTAETALITNGGFEEGFEGWTLVNYFGGEPEDLLVTLNPGEGMTSFVMMPGPTLRRDVQIDGAGVYRLTFKMRSFMAGSLRLIPYFVTAEGKEFTELNYPDDPDAIVADRTDNARRGYFGTGASGWYDVSFDISVPSDKINMIRLDFANTDVEDDGMVVDDFALTKISDKTNYVNNGQYEYNGTNSFAWSNIHREADTDKTFGAFLQTDASGNQYMEWKAAPTIAGGWSHQTIYLPSGRYRFAADLKGVKDGDTVAMAIEPKSNVDRWGTHGGINTWLEWYRVYTKWQTFETYFTVPTDAEGNPTVIEATFYFPMAHNRPSSPIPTFYADNVVIEKAEESFIRFSSAEIFSVSKKVWITLDDTNKPAEKLSDVGTGKTLPVQAVYVPEVPGEAEKGTLAIALYKKENGKLVLADIKFVSKEKNVTDGVNGASAQGLICFNESITLPADLNTDYVAKAFLWKTGKMDAVASAKLAY